MKPASIAVRIFNNNNNNNNNNNSPHLIFLIKFLLVFPSNIIHTPEIRK